MKKYSLCIFAMLSLLVMSGCVDGLDAAKSELRADIASSRGDCPIKINDEICMDSISYDEQNVTIYYTVDETKYDLDTFCGNAYKGLSDDTSSVVSKLGESLKKANADLIIVCKGKNSGECSFTVDFSENTDSETKK